MQEKYLAPWYFAADTSDPKDAFSKLVSRTQNTDLLLVVARYSSGGIKQTQQQVQARLTLLNSHALYLQYVNRTRTHPTRNLHGKSTYRNAQIQKHSWNGPEKKNKV